MLKDEASMSTGNWYHPITVHIQSTLPARLAYLPLSPTFLPSFRESVTRKISLLCNTT